MDFRRMHNQLNRQKLDNMAEEEIVLLARSGNPDAQEYILRKYQKYINYKTRSYFMIGAEKEDIIQEGMVGLIKAIRDFEFGKLASFKTFAELCITRQIITAVKGSTRQKHMPLNSYVSLSKPVYDEESEHTLMDMVLPDSETDPEALLIFQEEIDTVESNIKKILSRLEWQILQEYLSGKSYQEISEELGKSSKSIDNALQRIKKKFGEIAEVNNFLIQKTEREG